jgi:serine/threonine-protein kinase RsbW
VRNSLVLPGRPESVRTARQFTDACLPACPSVFEAMLCADELVTNAVEHSRSGLPGGTLTIRVITEPGQWLRVEVEDAGPRLRAVPANAGPLAEHGRGLALVNVLADTTGQAAGLAWFSMAWTRHAEVPEPRHAPTPAELRTLAVLGRSDGMCQCKGHCGRAGHRCGIGETPGHPMHIVAAAPSTCEAAAARLPAEALIALCAACRAGRDRIAARARAAAAAEPDGLFALVVTP